MSNWVPVLPAEYRADIANVFKSAGPMGVIGPSIGIFYFFSKYRHSDISQWNTGYMIAISIVALLFAVPVFYLLKIALQKPVVFTFTEEGVHEGKNTFVKWNEISEAKKHIMNKKRNPTTFVVITVKNREAYRAKLGLFQKIKETMRSRIYKAQIVLNTVLTGTDPDEVIRWINEYKDLYGRQVR